MLDGGRILLSSGCAATLRRHWVFSTYSRNKERNVMVNLLSLSFHSLWNRYNSIDQVGRYL